MINMLYIVGVSFLLILFSCSPEKSTPHAENIFLGSLHHSKYNEPSIFNFVCPQNDALHLVIRLKSGTLSDSEKEILRKNWEDHYSSTVRIYDSEESLVFSETFNYSRNNISTGGNWMKPDVSVILFKSIKNSLISGRNYRAEIILDGTGLEDYSLELFLKKRIYR